MKNSDRLFDGQILMFEPKKTTPEKEFFKDSIVLLSYYEKGEESFGYVLNKRDSYLIHEALDDFPFFEAPVYLGGPITKEEDVYVNFFHRIKNLPGAYEFCNSIYEGGNVEDLKNLILTNKISPKDIVFYIGCTSWQPGELEEEVNKNLWSTHSFNESILFHEHDDDKLADVLLKKKRFWMPNYLHKYHFRNQ